jgi:hypothetical protein
MASVADPVSTLLSLHSIKRCFHIIVPCIATAWGFTAHEVGQHLTVSILWSTRFSFPCSCASPHGIDSSVAGYLLIMKLFKDSVKCALGVSHGKIESLLASASIIGGLDRRCRFNDSWVRFPSPPLEVIWHIIFWVQNNQSDSAVSSCIAKVKGYPASVF